MRPENANRRVFDNAVAWLPLVVLPPTVFCVVPATWPRWVMMWLLATSIYAGCKWLTWSSIVDHSLRRRRDWGYLLAWPGLDAPAFLTDRPLAAREQPRPIEWVWAVGKLIAGLALWCLAARWSVVPGYIDNAPYDLAVGWLGMAALVLGLHCGLFHLLSCAWRAVGVDARPLMNRPLAARTLSEFWSRRWNTAFRDLAHRYVFAPLSNRWGARSAILLGFLFSGLVHDAVISLPAGGGYGGPTLFFAVQGAGLLAERHYVRRDAVAASSRLRWPKLRERALTLLVIVVPAGLLFHPLFVRGIVLAMLRDVAGFVGL
jgi:hypothetical protein